MKEQAPLKSRNMDPNVLKFLASYLLFFAGAPASIIAAGAVMHIPVVNNIVVASALTEVITSAVALVGSGARLASPIRKLRKV